MLLAIASVSLIVIHFQLIKVKANLDSNCDDLLLQNVDKVGFSSPTI